MSVMVTKRIKELGCQIASSEGKAKTGGVEYRKIAKVFNYKKKSIERHKSTKKKTLVTILTKIWT